MVIIIPWCTFNEHFGIDVKRAQLDRVSRPDEAAQLNVAMCTPTRVVFCIAFPTNCCLHAMNRCTFAEVDWDEICQRERQGPF